MTLKRKRTHFSLPTNDVFKIFTFFIFGCWRAQKNTTSRVSCLLTRWRHLTQIRERLFWYFKFFFLTNQNTHQLYPQGDGAPFWQLIFWVLLGRYQFLLAKVDQNLKWPIEKKNVLIGRRWKVSLRVQRLKLTKTSPTTM